ncbi:MAG: hypothetical protein AB2A00_05015 [Myxococcota bacterium]
MTRTVMCALVALAAACGETPGDRPDVIEVKHEESVEVGGGPTGATLENNALNTPQTGAGLSASLTTSLQNQGVTKTDVESVKMKQVRLEVTAPLRNNQPLVDLDFLDSLSMFVASEGKPEVLVAQSEPPPGTDGGTGPRTFADGVFAVDVPLTGAELKDYVTAESMSVRTDIVANRRPTLSCTVKFTTVMEVKISPAAVTSRAGLPTP